VESASTAPSFTTRLRLGDKAPAWLLKRSTAAEFRDGFLSRPSPISQGAPRADEILLMDFASDSQAMTKLRLRIMMYDYWNAVKAPANRGRGTIPDRVIVRRVADFMQGADPAMEEALRILR